jgi:hypothetical protein
MGANFSRVPVPWLRLWLEMGLSPLQMGVMVELCRWVRSDGTSWCPRRKMAEELGCKPQSVSNAIKALREKGLIRLVSRGGPNRATVYALSQASGGVKHLPGGSKCFTGGEDPNTYPRRVTEHLPNVSNPY